VERGYELRTSVSAKESDMESYRTTIGTKSDQVQVGIQGQDQRGWLR